MARRAPAPIDTRERIRAGASALHVELDDAALSRMAQYVDELERWNERSNLVGEHDRRSLIDRHVVDSLAAVPVLRRLGDGLRIADIGSGAGLPGIPLAIAIAPREMVLVEPRRKRASFLRAIRRLLPDAGIVVFEGRAEDLVAESGSFDAVVSRAALSDEELSQVARVLLRGGGVSIAYRGESPREYVAGRDAARASEQTLSTPEIERYRLATAARSFSLVVRRRLDRFT